MTASPGGNTATGTASPITVTGLTNGTAYTFTITASNFAGASAASLASNPVTPIKDNQNLIFGVTPTMVLNGTGTVSATATSSLPVSFTSTTPGVCTVSGSTVTGIAAGTCTIAADQAGNAAYNAATQVTQSITIGKANQTVSFGAAPVLGVSGSGTVSATATSGLAASFSSSTPGVCTISGSTVTGVSVGTCTLAADQAGDANYNAATQVSQIITVGKGSQAINFGAAPAVVAGGTGTVSATGGASGNTVTFSTTTPSICTINGSTVAGVAAGTCIIVANQAGDANYNNATQVTQSITIATALTTGWNLLGNSSSAPIDVATKFGDASKITTVWKWSKAASKWAFYAPSKRWPRNFGQSVK